VRDFSILPGLTHPASMSVSGPRFAHHRRFSGFV
jgi:hypothetical protein